MPKRNRGLKQSNTGPEFLANKTELTINYSYSIGCCYHFSCLDKMQSLKQALTKSQ